MSNFSLLMKIKCSKIVIPFFSKCKIHASWNRHHCQSSHSTCIEIRRVSYLIMTTTFIFSAWLCSVFFGIWFCSPNLIHMVHFSLRKLNLIQIFIVQCKSIRFLVWIPLSLIISPNKHKTHTHTHHERLISNHTLKHSNTRRSHKSS